MPGPGERAAWRVTMGLAGALGAALAACGDTAGTADAVGAATDASAVTDASEATDIAATSESDADASVSEADAADATGLAASAYCESIVASFCDYYLRCGRMAVPDLAACRATFLETCNARYEPLWRALADDHLLELSADGLATCEGHLATVACERQIFDLDGGCAGVWRGLVPAGGACGPGLESFVCEPGTTCVLGLDFCGTCRPLAGPDEACDLDHRCPPTATCTAGSCQARALPGDRCDADHPCVLGADCASGTCRADAIVEVGDACDATHACQYKAACVTTANGARCVGTALIGEACGDEVGCASGACIGGACAPLGGADATCDGPAACESGRCSDGTCAPIRFGCTD